MRIAGARQRLAVREADERMVAEHVVRRPRLLRQDGDLQDRLARAPGQLVAPRARQRIAIRAQRGQRGQRLGVAAVGRMVVRQTEAQRAHRLGRRVGLGGGDLLATSVAARLRRRQRALQPGRGQAARVDGHQLAQHRLAARAACAVGAASSARPASTLSAIATAGSSASSASASRLSSGFARSPRRAAGQIDVRQPHAAPDIFGRQLDQPQLVSAALSGSPISSA